MGWSPTYQVSVPVERLLASVLLLIVFLNLVENILRPVDFVLKPRVVAEDMVEHPLELFVRHCGIVIQGIFRSSGHADGLHDSFRQLALLVVCV